jgi:hypothetical protein
MSEAPRRIEVEEALSQVSEAARKCNPYPFIRSEFFIYGNIEKLDDVISPEVRELVKAGLLKITVKLEPVSYDDEYRSWKQLKDLPCPRPHHFPCDDSAGTEECLAVPAPSHSKDNSQCVADSAPSEHCRKTCNCASHNHTTFCHECDPVDK